MRTMIVAHRDVRPTGGSLVEREAALAALRHALDEALTGRGRLVVVRGEAGIGKTALVRAFLDAAHPGIRTATGTCDGFSTPTPFAPLEDIAPALGREFGAMLDAGTAYGPIARWVRQRLSQAGPWILVVEDIQWADEATLELLVYLARRLDGLRCLIITTCRDDEAVARAVERTLGRLATVPGVSQLPLPRLSRQGIAALAAGSDFDVDEVARLTGGNPLFVHEVLRSGGDRVPVSIRDAIRERLARVDRRARRALVAAAIAGSHAEPWLVAALAGEDVLGLDDCIREGLLVKAESVAFAHELTRMVVLDEMPVIEAIALHRRALETLRRAGSTDAARLTHHAEAAADAAAVVEYARAAGRKAVAMSALREAAVQFRRALRFAGHLAAGERAQLLEQLSYVLYLRNELAEAYTLGKEAVDLRRGGDVRALGSSLSALVYVAWLSERGGEAWTLAREAVRLLEPLGDTRELGLAYDRLGRLAVSAGLRDKVIISSGRALEIGDRLGDPEVRAIALANLGTIALLEGDRTGIDQLEASARLGREAGNAEIVDRALNNLGACATVTRELRRADTYFTTLEEHGERSEIVRCSIDEPRAEVALGLGDWAAAERHARAALDVNDPIDRVLARVVLARLEIRRGGTEVETWLADVAETEKRLDTTQLRWPLLACRAEQAWLAGTLDELEPSLRDGYAEACREADAWAIGELGRWLWLLGGIAELDDRAPLPYHLELAGDIASAAREWERLEMPYEMALCLAGSNDLPDLHRAHGVLVRLGATATADLVRRRIRALGGGAPRGPRRTTRAHRDGLTAREAEVAHLLAQGLSNAEIADRLVLSTRTVDHHVSALLAKLGIERRSQVAAVLVSRHGD